MELLLDIGNSRSKARLHDVGLLTEIQLESITAEQWSSIHAVYCASVAADSRVLAIRQQIPSAIPFMQIRSEAQAFGVTNSYQQPHLLGVDRWLALVAAAELYPNTDLLIADAGTALTIDWLSSKGTHQGGWILAGQKLQQEAVLSKTAKVFSAELETEQLCPATDTATALYQGAIAALVGAIRQAWAMKPAQLIILTGGDALLLQKYLADLPIQLESQLIFQGLARYIQQN
ncbi:MAG: type III pantothenate kinase [Gammaproteobacteria bacterium]|nr:type III pantothenate kinase [Gammaproteobacteria bacterium]MBU2059271.1 type III pantothenate kinase [Gammaproteobacteria bacterium]MBU2176809.1 type III pantothenate kinase [Gammaproteobacteria bacterium]MBU2246614.1 type III pantothenate kinase [Gammaproteobacteria bacterium]MBU2344382.1 type III pantothenate kinase [Gammaproteobacteria bacterium]